MYLDIAFKKENGADSVVDIVAATVGQGFPPVQNPSSLTWPPEQYPAPRR
jgi:hypothetical protein